MLPFSEALKDKHGAAVKLLEMTTYLTPILKNKRTLFLMIYEGLWV